MADSQILKALLPDNPLCGISTYKDTLNLATGACTRQIKKLVLTGEETTWNRSSAEGRNIFYNTSITPDYLRSSDVTLLCTHYVAMANVERAADVEEGKCALFKSVGVNQRLYIADGNYSAVDDFKTYLAQQYANGTPVTVWYVLATPEETTISVPSGLTGTEEGYLTQSETPTPTNPVYPTANEVLIWQHSLRKLTTSTDTITTLPADLYADGNNATVGISGNMSQTGTPTPDNPIMPQECGERTGNLYNVSAGAYQTGVRYNSNGDVEHNGNYSIWSIGVSALSSGTYTFSLDTTSASTTTLRVVGFKNGAKVEIIGATQMLNMPLSITVTDAYDEIRFSAANSYAERIMLNSGSTAFPYEPWGIKIPISSANTTTPVYLGEVQSTRRIKELVLTGDEDWLQSVPAVKVYRINVPDYLREIDNIPICTHYKGIAPVVGTGGLQDLETAFLLSASGNNYYYIRDDRFNNANDFKTYLQQQYAAGTPVCVWYVLANEETGIVNEPLCKIGNYADTVSGISIPTITGADSFDVLTTLKPSEVSLAYTGWHDASVKEKSENLIPEVSTENGWRIGYLSNGNYMPTQYYGEWLSPMISLDGLTEFTISAKPTSNASMSVYWFNRSTYLSQTNATDYTGSTFDTIPSNTTQFCYAIRTGVNGDTPPDGWWTMLSIGSTALPYEPYWK